MPVSSTRIKDRSKYKIIRVGELNEKGFFLSICNLCNQEFCVAGETPENEISKTHDAIEGIDHKFFQRRV